MKNSTGKVSFLQIFMVMMLFNGLLSHVILNPLMLDASGRDAWISVLLTAALYMPWCALLVFIMKKSGGVKFQPWLAKQTSPFLSWLLLVPVVIQLYFIGGLTIMQTSLWTVADYLPATPPYVLIVVLVLVCHFAAKYGLSAIAICSGLLLPTVVCLGYLVSFGNMSEKNWLLLRPFLEEGWGPSFKGMIYAGGAFAELSLFLLLQHRLKTNVKTWQIMLLGLVLVYITLGPIVGAITEFGPKEAAKQMVSPYEQWRLLKIGNYIEHVDFLSVFQWLSGATVRISLAQFLITDLLPFRTPKARNWFLSFLTLSYITLTIITSHHHTFYVDMFETYLTLSLWVTLTLTLIWTIIAWFAKPAKGEIP
ncbi:endospore germination permease [Paenibacillus spongiae]|uniref:Endospore germination permease n=1 Tax=Paenibacillus spongiae TaxID=2909671 RepID=A0ABY5SKH3_9BACL|nr:endospore germination permease [Paenibacillus spongiae]UVI33015.1 endospore germination permease [Paenibacillus spongiae]